MDLVIHKSSAYFLTPVHEVIPGWPSLKFNLPPLRFLSKGGTYSGRGNEANMNTLPAPL